MSSGLLISLILSHAMQSKPDLSLYITPGVTLFIKGTQKLPKKTDAEAAAQPVFLGYPHGPKTSEFVPDGRKTFSTTYQFSGDAPRLRLRVPYTADAMLCNTSQPGVIGSTYGDAHDLLANSVYFRGTDCLLTIDGTITHEGNFLVLHADKNAKLVTKLNYVQNHLGYFLWDPSRPLWGPPIVGWCSWAAYGQGVTEKDMKAAADFLNKNLLAYGYNIVQMDDGFQRTPQSGELVLKPGEHYSDFWTKPNDKFPSGLEALATYIKSQKITPGIWVGLYTPLGLSNSKDYVTGDDGKPYRGPWVNYAMNGLTDGADEAYFETIRVLKKQGWNYFKIDTLRHILYDNYRKNPFYWKFREESMEDAFRAVLTGVKQAAGGSYVLACWGTMPELAGLPNGARIGEDVGPDFASMRRSAKYIAQFHHLNNVVWRNDPDYMCLRLEPEKARAWASMVSLAGGQLMISDKPADYTPEHLNIMRRVSPTVFSKPVNLKQEKPDPEFFTLHCNKFGEDWTVVSHNAWQKVPARTVSLSDVGVVKGKYLAFDFWNQKFLGVVDSKLKLDALNEGHCQVVALRPVQNHPQVLGTERHISQGAYDLDAVKWDAAKATLSGTYVVGPGQRWNLTLYVPKGYKFDSAPKGIDAKQNGDVLTLTMPNGGGATRWSATFKKV
ncbi:MAG: hypothetical protein JST51_06310 [Armatimonadetes bacterium]|nr:hypothetical protein [Armatimonadota bacterium]